MPANAQPRLGADVKGADETVDQRFPSAIQPRMATGKVHLDLLRGGADAADAVTFGNVALG
jgi:hypothetical protein